MGSCLTVDELKNKYGAFLNPAVSVFIDEEELDREKYLIEEVVCELTRRSREAGTAFLRVENKENVFRSLKECLILEDFPLLAEVEIKTGYEASLKTVFKGIICERSLELAGPEACRLTVVCTDWKVFMAQNRSFQYYEEMKSHSTLVEAVTDKYGFAGKIGGSPDFAEPVRIMQNGMTDLELLCQAADQSGFELFFQNGELCFVPVLENTEAELELGPDSVLRYRLKTSLAGAVSQMEAEVFWPDTGESAVCTVQEPAKTIGEGSTAAELLEAAGLSVKIQKHMILPSAAGTEEIEAALQNEMDIRSMELVELSLDVLGLPELEPGRVIRLEGFGEELSVTCRIVEAAHRLRNGFYETSLTCCANAVSC